MDRFEEIAAGIPADVKKHANKLRLSEPDAADPPTGFPGEFKTVRVPLTHLDNLMDLTGELAINRIRLSQIAQTIENSNLQRNCGPVLQADFSTPGSGYASADRAVEIYFCSLPKIGQRYGGRSEKGGRLYH